MATQIQLRRDTAANWTSTNPILAQSEPAVETDTKLVKLGDGSTAWTGLPYLGLSVGSTLNAIATANPTSGDVAMNSHKITGLANGTTSTDAAAFGQIPTALPPNGSAGGDLTGTFPNPTVAAGKITVAKLATAVTLDAIASANATAANIAMNSHKITGLTNGSASSDAAAFGQIPTALPPNGSASGDLSGTFPGPTVAKVNGTSISGTPASGKTLVASSGTAAAWATLTDAQVGSSPTNVLTAKGDLLSTSAANTLSRLPIGATAQILTVVAGVPAWGIFDSNGNVKLGSSAGASITTGTNNLALGINALASIASGVNAVGVGASALQLSTLSNITAVGALAGYTPNGVLANASVAGARNTMIGYQSGASDATDPADFVAVGFTAIATTQGVALGSKASAPFSNSIAIGYTIAATAANQIALGGSSHQLKLSNNTTGSGSAALGANSPATTNTAPYTWFKMTAGDGSTVYVPAWK